MVLKWVRAQFGPRTDDFRELLVHRLPIEVGLLQEGHGLLVRFVRGGHRARSGASSAGASRSARLDPKAILWTRACLENIRFIHNSTLKVHTISLSLEPETKITVRKRREHETRGLVTRVRRDVEFFAKKCAPHSHRRAGGVKVKVPARL